MKLGGIVPRDKQVDQYLSFLGSEQDEGEINEFLRKGLHRLDYASTAALVRANLYGRFSRQEDEDMYSELVGLIEKRIIDDPLAVGCSDWCSPFGF